MKNYKKSVLVKIGILIAVCGLFFIGTTITKAEVINADNLIANPLLETPSTDVNIPLNWNKGYINPGDVVTYTYPVTDAPTSDISSGNSAKIEASSFTSDSDAKWYFDPVEVVPGRQYDFSDSYIATVSTDVFAAFCTDVYQNNCVYDTSHSISATPENMWKQSSIIFTVPEGKTYMTVFHRLKEAGTLIIDNHNLSLVPPPSPFSYGFVTLSFDDGLSSQYENALPKLIENNVKGVFFIVSHFISGFSISNPSVEIATEDNPNDWNHNNSVSSTYTYSSDSHTGSKAVTVNSEVANSNAGWYFNPITIIPDSIYAFSEFYKSTATSEIVVQITMNDNTEILADITDNAGNYLSDSVVLSPASNYTEVQSYFYAPENAKSVTILNRLTGVGSLSIDDIKLGRDLHMTSEQVLDIQNKGSEVGGHTQTHADLTTLNTSDLDGEVNGGRNDLIGNNINSVMSFAYPYGAFSESVQQKVSDSNYNSGRTVVPGFNGIDTPRFSLLSQSVNANTTLAQIKSWVDIAKTDKTWLILTFHDIKNDLTDSPYGTTPENLSEIIAYINSQDIPVKTMREGIELMGYNTPEPVDICPNVIGMQTEGTCADTLCITPNTWNTETQTCDAPIIPIVIPPTSNSDSSHSTTTTGSYIKKPEQGKVLGVEKFIFTKWLKIGSRGNEVIELQKFLNNAGYDCGIVDGMFGQKTKAAVIKFQIANGLIADGVIGPKTRDVLNK